jgi:hypothetical protein
VFCRSFPKDKCDLRRNTRVYVLVTLRIGVGEWHMAINSLAIVQVFDRCIRHRFVLFSVDVERKFTFFQFI